MCVCVCVCGTHTQRIEITHTHTHTHTHSLTHPHTHALVCTGGKVEKGGKGKNKGETGGAGTEVKTGAYAKSSTLFRALQVSFPPFIGLFFPFRRSLFPLS